MLHIFLPRHIALIWLLIKSWMQHPLESKVTLHFRLETSLSTERRLNLNCGTYKTLCRLMSSFSLMINFNASPIWDSRGCFTYYMVGNIGLTSLLIWQIEDLLILSGGESCSNYSFFIRDFLCTVFRRVFPFPGITLEVRRVAYYFSTFVFSVHWLQCSQ